MRTVSGRPCRPWASTAASRATAATARPGARSPRRRAPSPHGDLLNDRLAVGAETTAGYLETSKGHYDVFFIGVNGASTPDISGVLTIANDVADIAAILQENASGSS